MSEDDDATTKPPAKILKDNSNKKTGKRANHEPVFFFKRSMNDAIKRANHEPLFIFKRSINEIEKKN